MITPHGPTKARLLVVWANSGRMAEARLRLAAFPNAAIEVLALDEARQDPTALQHRAAMVDVLVTDEAHAEEVRCLCADISGVVVI